ncbi:MAG: hypothetical protein WCU88_09620 [Elusimicrobiota bacterium]|jgi:Tol biopolymer transport system component
MKRISLTLSVVLLALSMVFVQSFALPPFCTLLRWSSTGDIGIVVPDDSHLLLVKADGTLISSLTLEGAVSDAAVSPDSSLLAYSIQAQGLYVSKLDGTARAGIDSGMCQNLRWSADGSRIFYTRMQVSPQDTLRGTLSLFSAKADGSGKIKIYERAYGPE